MALNMIRPNDVFVWLAAVMSATGLTAAEPGGQSGSGAGLAPVSYQVRNKKFGELLRPQEARGANGTPIVLYPAQPWKCMTWKFEPAGASAFHLRNHFTSKTFAAEAKSEGAEAAVTQVPYGKEASERPVWQFSKLADGTYKITEAKSGKALTAMKGETGIRTVIGPWRDADEQKWELQEIDPKQLTM
jgi:hypothetical protein